MKRQTMTRHLSVVGSLLLFLVAADGARRNHVRVTRQASTETPQLVTVKETNVVAFDFGDDEALAEELKNSGRYDPQATLPFDVQGDSSRNRIFLTTPIVGPGIPVSLGTVPLGGPRNPPVRPYPNLDVHRTTKDSITDCRTQLVSIGTTTKTWSDPDTLYVLDSGVVNILSTPVTQCPPKIVIFDLRSDVLTNSTEISNAECNSIFTTIAVEECPDGKLVAYTSDLAGFALTVTDLTTGISRRLQSQHFYPSPGFGLSTSGGQEYFLMFGICGTAVDASCSGKLYFQPYSSNIAGVLEREALRNASNGEVLDFTTQVVFAGRRAGPSGPLAVDAAGQRVFFGIDPLEAFYCWNTSKPYNQNNFRELVQDEERLQFHSGIKIEPETDRVWILTDRLAKYLANTTDFSDINYRILYINIRGLTC